MQKLIATTKVTRRSQITVPKESIILNKEKFIQVLNEISASNDLSSVKNKTSAVKNVVTHSRKDRGGIVNIDANEDTISLRKDVLISTAILALLTNDYRGI